MASCFGRKKLFPTIKDVDEILTVELLEAAIGMTEIVGKYLTEVEQTRAQWVTDSPLCMFATSGFSALVRGFVPFPSFALGGFAIFFSILKKYSNYDTVVLNLVRIKDKIQ